MRNNIILLHKKCLNSNKGSGLGVIVYGITLLLILIFTAINIVNSKVIENGYNSLRDAVQTASSGSVIHLLTTNRDTTTAQSQIINGNNNKQVTYDIYLQLALGYLINRNKPVGSNDDTVIQSGEINNFIKLDHQKVVNTTLALLEDAVVRRSGVSISNTEEYKVLMLFIEPYRDDNGKKFFNIIAYGNGDYLAENIGGKNVKNIQQEIAIGLVDSRNTRNMKNVYEDVEDSISSIVNCTYDGMSPENKTRYGTSSSFNISLNSTGSSDYAQLIREMETYPHYVIVVKDFALPTIFGSTNTNDSGSGIKSLFTSLSGDGTLKSPMCALNTGKVQRQVEDAGWSHKR